MKKTVVKIAAVFMAFLFAGLYVPSVYAYAAEATATDSEPAPAAVPTETEPAPVKEPTETEPVQEPVRVPTPVEPNPVPDPVPEPVPDPAPDPVPEPNRTQIVGPVKDFLSKHNVLSYKYRPDYDYFYCDINNAWQENFGYIRLFDLAAPYIFLEYDYIRVHFEYGGKAWLVQFWKGQYGLVFWGSELGLYCKNHDGREDSYYTKYDCATGDNMLRMQTNLYKLNYLTGKYEHQFSTPDEMTWWSTGFKPGHLVREEPATELRLTGTITFKDAGMAEAFTKAMLDCGMPLVAGKDRMNSDSFCVDGSTVNFFWQDLSEAENTMVLKATAATTIFLSASAVAAAIAFAAMSMMGMMLFLIIL